MIDTALKSIVLNGHKKATQMFIQKHLGNFYDAIEFVHGLPYGRNTKREDFYLVLTENKGTCSTKHAILKQLGVEMGVAIELKLGIFLMDSVNTPPIKEVLNRYEIKAIPEAHCFLQWKQVPFDITFPDKIINPLALNFLETVNIEPDQIGQYKEKLHKQFIRKWLIRKDNQMAFETIWQCREACIQLLSQSI